MQRQQTMAATVQKEGRLFLAALQQVEYGRMVIVTPDNVVLTFAGWKKGPSAHLRLYDWKALDALVVRGEVGFAEAYIEGQWDSENLLALLTFGLVNSQSLERFFHGKPWQAIWLYLQNAMNGNSLRGSRRNVVAHYDLGNDFYALWLDKGMTYSCGLFDGDRTRTLELAQQAKYYRILHKLGAKPGEHILEIGCGWGGFAETAAREGLYVTAITLSDRQALYAQERITEAKLDKRVSVELMDYRQLEGSFDHIVSIGMFEHVGERYWPVYFRTIREHLKPGGKAMIQSITLDDYLFETLRGYSGFIEKYIFPGGMLPSKARFCAVAAREKLECEEIYGFGQDYIITLEHWLSRFEAQKENIKAIGGYDEAFLRLWRFYLCSCIASFSSQRTDVMQALLTHAE